MNDAQATRQSYDELAVDYARLLGDELAGKPLDRALLAALAELAVDGPLADVGCGPGHVTAHLAALGATTFGMDLSPRMCSLGASTTGLSFAAGDMTALPLRTDSLAGVACLYAVIHLDEAARSAAYAEFARVLRPGGHLLISFHVRDADVASGSGLTRKEMMGHDVDLTFHYLDPDIEVQLASEAGLAVVARLDRAPYAGAEHPSERSYLILRAG